MTTPTDIQRHLGPQEGRFVRLRPLVESDDAITLAWRSSERAQLLNDGATTIADQRAWIADRGVDELNFIIEKVDGTPVGMISLVNIDLREGSAEPARFLIGEERTCRGIPAAAEALSLLYALAFDQLRLTSLYGYVVEDNTLMIKWHRYFGMRTLGVGPETVTIGGQSHRLVKVVMTMDEYRSIARPRFASLLSFTTPPTKRTRVTHAAD